MAARISINVEAASSIYNNSMNKIGELREGIDALMALIESLRAEGEWAGDAADRFFNELGEMKSKFTHDFPEALTQLTENFNTNLKNLIEADAANA